jgi:hypothetical protein
LGVRHLNTISGKHIIGNVYGCSFWFEIGQVNSSTDRVEQRGIVIVNTSNWFNEGCWKVNWNSQRKWCACQAKKSWHVDIKRCIIKGIEFIEKEK